MNDKSALLLDALLLSEALLWTLTLVGSMSFDIMNESSDSPHLSDSSCLVGNNVV